MKSVLFSAFNIVLLMTSASQAQQPGDNGPSLQTTPGVTEVYRHADHRVAATSLRPAVTSGSLVRTFVSSTGLDTNPCTRVSPCRSFGAGIGQTLPGGVVIAIDSAGYGAVAIGGSVTLLAPEGVYAALTATSGTAVTISGAAASDVVVLRGLSIEGLGIAAIGVYLNFDHLKTLRIQNCAISGFTGRGIDFEPTNTGAALYVSNTTLDDAGVAIYAFANPGNLPLVSIDRVAVTGGSDGIWVEQSNALISNSVVAGVSGYGIIGQDGTTQITLDHCSVNGAQYGLASGLTATMRVSNSVIVNNSTALSTYSGGTLYSVLGDVTSQVKTNIIENNTTNGSFTGYIVAQ